ncbi:MAG: VWA domain-containing protein [Rhodocyclaceae bacterium]|nr:VWA domain-containing protein [Rhodocyclaceae bacterium]
MTGGIDFLRPELLALLPLAALPLFARSTDARHYPHLGWLPADPAGRLIGLLLRLFAALAIAAVAIALAAPGRAQTVEPRTGRGAELLLLIDRSRSMDERMLPSDWRELSPYDIRHQTLSRGPVKSRAARELLADFVARRPDDRFAVSFFSASTLYVVPFTQHDEVVQAGIAAGGVHRGLSETDVGRALISSVARFEKRAYSGSRIILLVSDGGARLDEDTRLAIRAGFERQRVALYWIYLKGFGRPDLEAAGEASEAIPEVALHRFFQTLPTPYHAYQAQSPEDLAAAVADVGRQQNHPLDFEELIPRRDYSRHFVALALALVAVLVLARRWQLGGAT